MRRNKPRLAAATSSRQDFCSVARLPRIMALFWKAGRMAPRSQPDESFFAALLDPSGDEGAGLTLVCCCC